MKRILYIIYIMVATLAVTLFGGCEEQVFEYDFINNAGEESTPTPTPTPGVNAKNVIYYTSTDGKVITPNKDAFGVSIVSNTYTNGKGTITFSGTVTKIGEEAFYKCSTLTSITIPNSVTSIGSNVFLDCTSLKSFYGKFVSEDNRCLIVNGVLTAFAPAGLTSYIIPNNVTSIGDFAFSNCTKLTSVTIPNGVTSIGNQAFGYCSGLTSVTIPDSVTSIGIFAFYLCSKLAEVYCKPTTPPTLESYVFYQNASDRKIYVPSASVNAYKTATNWREYASQIVADGSSAPSTTTNVIEYTSSDGNVVTPYNTSAFGANIVSNVYENGKGTITFDGPVTKIGEHAFRNCTSLTSVTIPDSVTSIGNYAFRNCTSLTSVTIPDSVTSIGNYAFEYCTSLTSVTIPESVTSIGYNAFYNCFALTSVTIPNSVTEIGKALFSGCTSLKSFYGKFASEDNRCLIVNGVLMAFAPAGLTSYIIPNSVTSIEYYAFEHCTSLTSVTIPNSVTSIGDYAFRNCTSLTSVTIPNSVTSIGSYAFRSCTSLTSVTIPNSVTEIGNYAFHSCSKLAEVYCKPTTPPTLGGSAVFDSNASDRKIYVPSASVNAYKAANYWSEYADQIVADGSSAPSIATNTIEYTSSDGNVVTPYKTDVFGANIVSNVYENGKGKITFDGPVTTIGEQAFYTRSTLASITIPESVTEIGSSAFRNCTSLTSVTIPNSVTSIGDNAFFGCTLLSSVTIPNSVTEIGTTLFSRCTSLKSFYGKFASEDNRCLIVNGVLRAFAPAGLTSYIIPNDVTSIGDYAFYYCSGLTSVTIPNSVTSIENYAFYNCDSLTSVTIPNSVTSIGDSTFYSCTSLTSVTIPDSVTSIGDYAFRNCTSLTSVTIPNNVTSIGTYAFGYCSDLTSVTIPNSVTLIGSYAFRNCTSLTSVIIPDSVTSIGNNAFYNCSKLAEVYCKPTTPPTLGGSAVFDSNASDRKIYVPSASVSAYKTATYWSEYASQIVAEGSSTTEYVIEYTSTDGNIVTPNAKADFGANIVSNVYENGKGVITFDGPVTKISDSSLVVEESSFYGCKTLTSITIPASVTSIDRNEFVECTSLKSFYGKFASEDNRCLIVNGELTAFAPAGLTTYSIPNNVTTIGAFVFYKCIGLTSITIPNSVTSIEKCAFASSSLVSVTIPNSVTGMGESPFRECTSLKSFYGKFASEDNRCLIVNGVLNSFAPAGLTSYIIPNSVTSIGNNVFYRCSSLTSMTIPDSVISIGYYAFYNCTSLTSVTIPNNVTWIGDYAFKYCSKLAEVYCKPTTPPTLGGSAVFDNNASGRKIYVPSASVDAYKAANYWSEYASQIVAEGSSTATNVIEYTSSDGNIVTPNSTADFGANIVSNVYENGKGKITFDGPVTKISNISTIHTVDESSFYDCKTLTSITIPDSVTSIRICQFVGCSSLKSFYGKFASEDNRCLIVNGVLTAFAPAGLTTYSIPENVTSINNHVFNSCTDLTSVTIPNSVTSMGYGVFVGCTSLKRVDITDLEAWCKIDFYSNNANPLNNGADLYLNGSKVTALTIPSSITEIKQYTFYGCPSLTSVTIPNSVTEIGETPFGRCTLLKSFYGKYASEDNRCLIVDGVLNTFAPAGLTTYSIPNSVTSIGDYVFYRCSSLTNVTIPESVTSIGNYAFYYCTSLTSVTIPNSVTSIGSSAFYGCSKLAEVYCKPTTPPTLGGVSVFYSNASGRKIYVPSASVSAYKTATNWSEYAGQIVAE